MAERYTSKYMTPVSNDEYLSRTHQYSRGEEDLKDIHLSPVRPNEFKVYTGHYRVGSKPCLRAEPIKSTYHSNLSQTTGRATTPYEGNYSVEERDPTAAHRKAMSRDFLQSKDLTSKRNRGLESELQELVKRKSSLERSMRGPKYTPTKYESEHAYRSYDKMHLPVAYDEVKAKQGRPPQPQSHSSLGHYGGATRKHFSSISYPDKGTPKKEQAESQTNSNPNMTFQSESGTSQDFVADHLKSNNRGSQREEYGELKTELIQMKKQLSRVIEISIQKNEALELKLKDCQERIRKQDLKIQRLELALKYRSTSTTASPVELESKPLYSSPFTKMRLTNNNDIQAQIDRQIDRFERYRHHY